MYKQNTMSVLLVAPTISSKLFLQSWTDSHRESPTCGYTCMKAEHKMSRDLFQGIERMVTKRRTNKKRTARQDCKAISKM